MDVRRFIDHMGEVAPDKMEEIVLAIAAVVEYP
jgi:hypothetical protein